MSMQRETRKRVVAVILLVLAIALNVYGYFTLPATTQVGGAFTRNGQIVEMPTWLLLVACALFITFMCIKQMFEKRPENDSMWMIVNPILVVLNAVLILVVL